MIRIEIQKWVDGAPVVVREWKDFDSEEHGFSKLHDIGHSWDYDMNFAGYLYNDDVLIGRLDILQHTYHFYDVR